MYVQCRKCSRVIIVICREREKPVSFNVREDGGRNGDEEGMGMKPLERAQLHDYRRSSRRHRKNEQRGGDWAFCVQ